MSQEFRDIAMLHFVVIIWGFTAILGAVIDLPPVEIVFFRTLFASIGLLVLLSVWRKPLTFTASKDYLVVTAVGVIIAAHWIMFFLAARLANISICLAGMATCSMWTSLIEPLFFKRKIKLFEVVLSAIAFVGIAIVFNVEFDNILGFSVAVGSAFLATIFSVINARLIQRIDPYVITFYQMIGACLTIVLFFPFYSDLSESGSLQLSPSWSDLGYLLILSLVCTVFAFSYGVLLMRRLSAFFVNLTTNLEPVYGILMALFLFPETEKMTSGFYLGTSLILLSVLIYPIINRSLKRKALGTDLWR
ncbi:DMT family transporter [Marinoscillum sp. MHG1-6]|uniref:DMT family transporter n=1 Tax=Marinoscillum sp. MHG1-6 TaxID=2959627 RepID=UPI0021588468|nr:DMT family transporter [Marinoscillum sp. MHG1-6]